MTISSATFRQIFVGDGSNRTFALPFSYPGSPYTLATTEVEVWTRDETTTPATEVKKTIVTDYVITGTNVVFVTAPVNLLKVMLRRRVPLTQLLDLLVNGSPAPDDQEGAYDRNVMAIQQLNEELNRSLKLQKTSSQTPPNWPDLGTALQALRINAAGTGLEFYTTAAASSIAYAPVTNGFSQDLTVQAAIDKLNTRIHGNRASPVSITTSGISSDSGVLEQIWFIKGNGGAIDLTAVNPQISAGTLAGQKIRIIGCDDTNTVLIGNGNLLITNGNRLLEDGTVIEFTWGGGLWEETHFNNL